jgi:hypothetical protein
MQQQILQALPVLLLVTREEVVVVVLKWVLKQQPL